MMRWRVTTLWTRTTHTCSLDTRVVSVENVDGVHSPLLGLISCGRHWLTGTGTGTCGQADSRGVPFTLWSTMFPRRFVLDRVTLCSRSTASFYLFFTLTSCEAGQAPGGPVQGWYTGGEREGHRLHRTGHGGPDGTRAISISRGFASGGGHREHTTHTHTYAGSAASPKRLTIQARCTPAHLSHCTVYLPHLS